jgi:hypothetical protein
LLFSTAKLRVPRFLALGDRGTWQLFEIRSSRTSRSAGGYAAARLLCCPADAPGNWASLQADSHVARDCGRLFRSGNRRSRCRARCCSRPGRHRLWMPRATTGWLRFKSRSNSQISATLRSRAVCRNSSVKLPRFRSLSRSPHSNDLQSQPVCRELPGFGAQCT